VIRTLVFRVVKPVFAGKKTESLPHSQHCIRGVLGVGVGPAGAILSIPMTMFVQALLEKREQTR
jgi:hypothetical protein